MKKLTMYLIVSALLLVVATPALALEKVRFGVPPWPGVEVKTEVVHQILDALGYPMQKLEIGPPIIYKGLVSDEVDAFLGGWIPQQNPMLDPLLEKKAVEVAQTNLDTARISLCVPRYVSEAGVKTFADLNKHADQFKHTVYNIEAGSGMNTNMGEIIANNVAGLGDWKQTGATVAAMLTQVKSMMKDHEWVVFGCWKPHWMNVTLDMVYLDGVPGTEKFASDSKVYTVVSVDLKDRHPQVYRFLKNMKVDAKTQSQWIMDYANRKIPADKVAADWIATHNDTIATWLDGVQAADGTDAMEKIKEKQK
ncbi:ABC transporter substrate-binding protein [Desulfovibrio inopinatus]|uniref:ABC transporter substrate-binding protein n=1 Tax=Desulfovibrio inopinatus TaxID=102109 RepID=UPI00040E14C9|nr:ABC transporter substrate-binding protein [Desulfovibrio inopinatus]